MKTRRFLLVVGVIVALGAPRSAHGQWLRVAGSQGFHCLIKHGADLYAGTGDTFGGGFVVVSSDSGATWKRLDTAGWPKKKKGMPIVFIVDCLAWNGSDLIAGTNEGVYVSKDGGGSWTAGAGFAQDLTVYCLAVGESRLFAGTQRHVLVSADGGLTWTPAAGAGLPGSYIEHLALRGTDLFAGTFNGIWVSKDDGATWAEAGNGLPKDRNVYRLAVSGSYLLTQLSASGFFRSPDGGANWTRADAGLPAKASVQCLAEIGGKLLAGVSDGGVFVSSDNGGTWAAMNEGWPSGRISVFWLSESGGQILAGAFNDNVTNYEIWRWPSAGAAAAGGGETAQTYFDNGQRAFQAGDFSNAIMLFGKAIERDPRSAAAWLQRAWSYVKLGGRSSYDSALIDVAKALELSSAEKSAYFLRGEIFRNQAYFALDKGDHGGADALLAKALADYKVALEANPNSPVIPVSIGAASAARGDLDGALAAYAGVFERDPYNKDLTGRLQKLFQLYVERKKEIDCGTFGRTWDQAGRFYEKKREYASAIRCYSRALDLGFIEWSVYWGRAHAYEAAGDLAKALADADTMVKIPPPSPHSHSYRAEIHDKMGQLDKAIEDYSEAIRLQWKSIKELDTDDKDVEYLKLRTQRANVYTKKGEWNKAIGDLQYVSDKLRPGSGKAKVLRGIGSVYQKKGDARNAQKYFDQAEAMERGVKKEGGQTD